MKRLFLIHGKAGSGKDFLGDILEKKGYKRFAFADHLKELTSNLYDIALRDLHTQEGKKKIYNGKTYRQILIEESTKYKKKDKYFFARIVIDAFKKSDFNIGFVTDFRFPYELCYAKKELEGFCDIKTILIQRDNYIHVDDDSERALGVDFHFDYILDNNGTAFDLEKQLFSINL